VALYFQFLSVKCNNNHLTAGPYPDLMGSFSTEPSFAGRRSSSQKKKWQGRESKGMRQAVIQSSYQILKTLPSWNSGVHNFHTRHTVLLAIQRLIILAWKLT